jgi:hypothetical protein
MSKAPVYATLALLAFSFISVSCAGTNLFHVPGGPGMIAAAPTPDVPSSYTGVGIFLLFALALAVTIGAANFIAGSSMSKSQV